MILQDCYDTTRLVGQPMPANKLDVVIPVRVGDSPIGIAVNPNNNLVYVTNSESDTVSVIDRIK